MIRLTDIEERPFETLSYRTSGPKGRILRRTLPIFRARGRGLPTDVGCAVLASDLQGREIGGQQRLLGEVLAQYLAYLQRVGDIPPIGIAALCGDLYDYPDCHKRGGTGDVDAVWHAFAAVARHVVGVLGNHDSLNQPSELPDNVHLLDGDLVGVEGIRVGGVSGIVGDPRRNQRKALPDYLQMLDGVTQKQPDLLLLHQGPDAPDTSRRGDPMVRLALEAGYSGLTVFGHAYWADPFVIALGEGQALNVDSRVVLVYPAGE
ncbi:metallophosphoesterase family protein [Mangrovitalea sediminis]|uniref:metallophosphoesterase family protein n=1 Tax=Mangrovitalea sediminis TaxID=1982043 RepID=UPI000BE4EB4B|nr:hypothetical protein [Mangrovitalea sediminis]